VNDDTEAPELANGAPADHRRWRLALMASAVVVCMVAGTGVLAGLEMHRVRQRERQEERVESFVLAASHGAAAITTIDAAHVDDDVQRILGMSTASFHDDFQGRAAAFVNLVHTAQSVSQGTVTSAGVESFSGDEARVMVLMSVTTSVPGVPASQPKAWRMRITVRETAPVTFKLSEVEFIP
jgi:Mce-associated membrane protein